jgi:C4-dicarboxylate transporter, DcuC family
MAGPLISLLFVALAAYLLTKKYNPQASLLLTGMAMLLVAPLLGLAFPELQQPTGAIAFDLFAVIKESFSKTNANVGLMIMAIGGFVAYMDKIGASDVLVQLAMRPLQLFKKNPYLAASMVIPIGQVLFIAIPSAAGLSLLLMASLFPILTRLGVSKLSAASVITASTVFGIGPACATTASAVEIMQLDTVLYFLEYQIPLVWPLSLSMTVSYYFVNRYFDQKNKPEVEAVTKAANTTNAPMVYGLLPILPIILLMVFSELFQVLPVRISLDTTTVMFISLFVAILFEGVRYKALKPLLNSLNVFWNGMGDIFKNVVTLIITADIFAKGLISLGFIDGIISATQSAGFGAIGIGVAITVMILLSAMLMGSGNAAFFAFGPLVPGIATQLQLSATSLMLPMQLAATMGRTISPVAGVLIATADLAGVSSLDIVKRNLIPVAVALVLMLLLHFV